MSKNSQDIAALESMEVAYNYNKYVFNKVLSEISGNQVLDFGAGFGLFCKFLQKENKNIYAYLHTYICIYYSEFLELLLPPFSACLQWRTHGFSKYDLSQ